ncbi:MAG: hypothetical protein U0324_36735 [Polyangiales bacterium]
MTTMTKQATRLAVAIAPLVLASCTDAGRAPPPNGARSNLIRDELHNGGTRGFIFLPPMVPRAAHDGDNVWGVSPTVQIDEICSAATGGGCTLGTTVRTLASFTATTGPERERLRRHERGRPCDSDDDDGDDDEDDYYYVRWFTRSANLSTTALYRARVFVPSAGGGQRELGFADVAVARNAREFRSIDTENFTPLLNGTVLRIKFRIERPAVDGDRDGDFDWADNCPTVANPDQRDTDRDGRGDACECAGVTCVALDTCHAAGTCQSTTGVCTNPIRSNGTACSRDHATATCQAGACTLGACAAGYANCDGNAANGCEAPTNTVSNCGACGRACAGGPNATAACAAGSCALTCAAGYANCDGNAANGCERATSADAANCGGCGVRCPASQVCRAGACTAVACAPGTADCNHLASDLCEVTPASDVANCGACGNVCAVAHGTPSCASGACGLARCDADYANCDGNAANGCEASTLTDVANCGACGRTCSPPNASPVCNAGACAVASCTAGFADCDGDAANGCEVSARTDVRNCGACGNACNVPHATPACAAGACAVGACDAGWADCNGDAGDGCEVDTTTVSNCNACGAACAAGPNAAATCRAGGCGIACAPGFADCDGDAANGCERSTSADVSNCGGCGVTCTSAQRCVSGSCTAVTCAGTTRDCNSLAADLCEVDTATDAHNCGACGRACAFPNAAPQCAAGACAFSVCDMGFADCDGQAANGCEVSVRTDDANCGACGHVCAPPHASGVCRAGACGVGACDAGWADCNGNPADGCEVDLQRDAAHCGACAGSACAGAAHASPICLSGRCATTCDPGHEDCDGAPGCEVDSASDARNCGACGRACSSAELCVAGACTAVTCAGNTADCNHLAADLCEVDTTSDVRHCGACGAGCHFSHAAASCAASACVMGACEAGFADVDHVAANGCEVDLSRNADHCGEVGHACGASHGTPACVDGACVIGACDDGFRDCDGVAATGCEVSLASDVRSCGACGAVCPTPASAVATCAAGACGFTCVDAQRDCDGAAGNGCEADTDADNANCGACGHACGAGFACRAGVCTLLTCAPGTANCDGNDANGCETSLADDPAHCGSCAAACTYAHATGVCTAETCARGACAAGFEDCNAASADGCETRLATDPNNCGGCGIFCTASHGTPACVAGACAVAACDAGFGDCDGDPDNGCEANLASSGAHCGACGAACPSGQGCSAGACAPVRSSVGAGLGSHQCVVRGGQVFCWGDNSYGQIGNGTQGGPMPPTAVVGITDAIAVTQGRVHTCALRSTGRVSCWGTGASGATGMGWYGPMYAMVPMEVPGVEGAVALSSGATHSCAVLGSGAVVCWGDNSYGQLGNSTEDPSVAVVNGVTDAVAVSCGAHHTCAVRRDGSVVCWGLWTGNPTGANAPTAVPGLSDVVSVSSGDSHICALRRDGTAACWGVVGYNYIPLTDPPTAFAGITDATSVVSGLSYFCVNRRTGGVACSGDGVFGDGSYYYTLEAVAEPIISDAVALGSGAVHMCALRSTGAIACWGYNYAGQIGVPVTPPVTSPVVTITDATSVDTGERHACGLRANGAVVCWGDNQFGALGAMENSAGLLPVEVPGIHDARAVSAGASFSCAVRATGEVACWGRGDEGQLGNGRVDLASVPTPANVVSLHDAVSVSAGYDTSCSVRSGGGVACWGGNLYGQRGDDNPDPDGAPHDVAGISDAVAVSVGGTHTCALRRTGTVLCWGANYSGQLGADSAITQSATPLEVPGLTDVVAISAGASHVCAVLRSGAVRCWGGNFWGQLGTGVEDYDAHRVPAEAVGLTDAVSISSGIFDTCARRGNGAVVCWGGNLYGEVGDGTTTRRAAPVAAAGVTDAVDVSTGWGHTCATRSNGLITCWGDRSANQLSDGYFPGVVFFPVTSFAAP